MFGRAVNVRRIRVSVWFGTVAMAGLAGMKLMGIVEARSSGAYNPRPPSYWDDIIIASTEGLQNIEQFEPKEIDDFEKVWKSPLNGHVKEVKKAEPKKDEFQDTEYAFTPIDTKLDLKAYTYAPENKGIAVVAYKDEIKIVSLDEEVLFAGSRLKHPYDGEPFHGVVEEILPHGVQISWGGQSVLLGPKLKTADSEPSAEEPAATRAGLSEQEAGVLDRYKGSKDSVALSELGSESYLIGTDDQMLFAEDPDNFQGQVRVGTQKGPNGQEVVVRTVKSSIGRKYGVRDGDVLVSINGVKMSSKQQAINYVRQNPDLSKYVVVMRRTGKEVTKTIYPPQDG